MDRKCSHLGEIRDATGHFHSSHHPLIRSFEPGEDWGWCYVDELLVERISATG